MIIRHSAGHGVFHAAGLRAHSAVAAATADKRGHIALSRVAEAQRAVNEDLRLDGCVAAYELYLLERKLAGKHSAGKPHLGSSLNACKIVYAHLGAGVQRNIRNCLSEHGQQAEILHEYRGCTEVGDSASKPGSLFHLPVADKGIHRDINLAVSYTAVSYRLFKFLFVKILSTPARIEDAQAHIHRISAVLNRRYDRFRRAGG